MTRKLIFCGLIAALGAVASAQVTMTPQPLPAGTPIMAAQLDAQGNRVSPFEPVMDEFQGAPEVQSWTKAFDNYHWDIATGAHNGLIYNPTAWTGFVLYQDTAGTTYVNQPLFANDWTLAPGTEGRAAQRFRFNFVWNPAGLFPISSQPNTSGYNPSVILWSVSGMNTDGTMAPWATLLGGIQYNFGSDTAPINNNFWGSGPIIAEGSTLNIPLGDGYIIQVLARQIGTGALSVVPTGNVQVGWRPMCGPDDPALPGTNPSNSDKFVWVDTNASNSLTFGGTTPEVYDYDAPTGTFPGRLQPGQGFAIDTNALYADFVIDRDAKAEEDHYTPVKWIATDAGGVPVPHTAGGFVTATTAIHPSATGQAHVIHPQRTDGVAVQNTYVMWIKPPKCLAKLVGPLTFAGASVDLGTINFLSGDIDNDNEIGPGDFGALASAFLSVPGDPNWNESADLDWDGEVGPGDFSFLATNFLEAGDADPTL